MSKPHIALLGLGLLGASIGHALKRGGLAEKITGFDVSADVGKRAGEIGFIDALAGSASAAVDGADIVFLNVPISAMAQVASDCAGGLKAGAIVTDIGSVKQAVIEAVQPVLPEGVHFVAGHPIAGTENSGPEAGFAELFDGRWCILTPNETTDIAALTAVKTLWEKMGCHVDTMDATHHDLVLAITSHVPHLIAYNIVGTAADLEQVTQSEVIKYSAGGFRDFTRIAASDPLMWRDVFLNNSEAVLEMLARFSEDLTALQKAIRWKDGEALLKLFAHTRNIRQEIIEAGQETPDADFGRNKTKSKAKDKPKRG